MAFLRNFLIGLRNDPRLLVKLPPLLSLLCIAVGLIWLLILPLDQYSRRAYISENALLPGQVNTYFGGSDHNIFRAYRHEVAELQDETGQVVSQKLGEIFESQGLKVGKQRYRYEAAGKSIAGHNVYAILQGPRADATEALVLIAAWRNMDDILNQSGVALLLTLARYFNRWSLWSKDIIFVVTGDSIAGPQAWVDAYHSTHNPAFIDDLPIKSGALQGALALDYTAGTGGHRFDKIHVIYDGVNGQLPNLDLLNTAVHISSAHMFMGCTIQRMWDHTENYKDRLQTVFRSMLTQGLGHASGPHSSFIPYHVDAITLQAVGDGWHDEMSLGRLVESTFRSLNNLLEHLHQSFFLYLLIQADRFISIGTYLPSAMLVAVNFSIMAIALWIQSGRVTPAPISDPSGAEVNGPKRADTEILERDGQLAVIPKALNDPSKRKVFFATSFVGIAHLLGLFPLYLFNATSGSSLARTYYFTTIISNTLPYFSAYTLRKHYNTSSRTLTLIPCLSLLILGIALSTLSTLNFPLGILIGLLASPLTFASPITAPSPTPLAATGPGSLAPPSRYKKQNLIKPLYILLLHVLSPTTSVLLLALGHARGQPSGASYHDAIGSVLSAAAQAWHITSTWTSVVVWLVWWPAWFIGVTVAVSGLLWPPDGHLGPVNIIRPGTSNITILGPANNTRSGTDKKNGQSTMKT